jgi:hypothetical protein
VVSTRNQHGPLFAPVLQALPGIAEQGRVAPGGQFIELRGLLERSGQPLQVAGQGRLVLHQFLQACHGHVLPQGLVPRQVLAGSGHIENPLGQFHPVLIAEQLLFHGGPHQAVAQDRFQVLHLQVAGIIIQLGVAFPSPEFLGIRRQLGCLRLAHEIPAVELRIRVAALVKFAAPFKAQQGSVELLFLEKIQLVQQFLQQPAVLLAGEPADQGQAVFIQVLVFGAEQLQLRTVKNGQPIRARQFSRAHKILRHRAFGRGVRQAGQFEGGNDAAAALDRHQAKARIAGAEHIQHSADIGLNAGVAMQVLDQNEGERPGSAGLGHAAQMRRDLVFRGQAFTPGPIQTHTLGRRQEVTHGAESKTYGRQQEA